VSSELAKTLNKEITDLYRRIDEDKRIQQAAGDAKQDAILRLLSSTLTDNVEQVIGRIVMTNIQQSVLPAISSVTSAAVERKLGESVSRSLAATLPAELHAIVPEAVKKIFGQPEFMARIGEAISRPLAYSMEQEISKTICRSLLPAFKQLSDETTSKLVADFDRKHNETIQALERVHVQDTQRIDQLTNTVKSLVDVVQAMAKSQAEFQDQVQRAQAEYVQAYEQTGEPEPAPRAPTPPPPPTPDQLEAEETERFLRNGRYEEGTIKWLQSKERQAELFDEVVVRYRYDFLPNLSQLVLLSVSAAVSIKFENKVYERLSWLEGVLAVLDPMDPEIHEICHRIMAVVVQRLEQLYMSTAENNMADPILRKIPPIARRARELSSMAA
jgi:phosphoglycolate phosphatase-like HAD superfamily hydrolase